MLKVDMNEFCSYELDENRIVEFIFIIFGGMGDLSTKKIIPSLFNLFKKNRLKKDFKIILHGRAKRSDEMCFEIIKKNLLELEKENFDDELFKMFYQKFSYYSENIEEPENCKILNSVISEFKNSSGEEKQIVFYLAVPPDLVLKTLKIIENTDIFETGTNKKIVMEKPFGTDYNSAKNLNKELQKKFKEDEIYRIDHYLGKETVQNILFFRFGNLILEPIWKREYIDHVQITISETIGIENRGEFYDKNGIIKDIIQNHMLQILSIICMEYPISFSPDSIRDEKLKIFKSIKKIEKKDIEKNIVLGQYRKGKILGKDVVSYLEEKSIEQDSKTPTFFSGKVFIENWRWSGVPFYLRAGKRLKEKVTEVVVIFKNPPLNLFGNSCSKILPNKVIFTIQPEEKIEITMNVKYPGDKNYPHPIKLTFDYSNLKNNTYLSAYERLILDILKGDSTLFAREDEIESMWKVVEPIIEATRNNFQIQEYFSGSWGPEASNMLIENDERRWIRYEDS
ncbi:glucose-6-phosphate dehydrogenase [Cetobacterium sp.]|uniref:glucose-6-phosphate dehydrogenase n=1 Tax=Cetobacterium sp. TaxID=2071632 RepID=UPI002FC6C81F